MFLTFKSEAHKRAFGTSDILEMRFCKLPYDTDIKEKVSTDSVLYWQDGSLYIADYENFISQCGGIFDCGTYNNLQSGPVDICGINYYAPDTVESIMEKLRKTDLNDREILIEWLNTAKNFNGFYILGV